MSIVAQAEWRSYLSAAYRDKDSDFRPLTTHYAVGFLAGLC
jgi:hypothetical protein